MQSAFDLLALLLVISAILAYLNYRVLKLPLTVGLLVGAGVGALALIALDAILPGLGLKPAIRSLVSSINFPATLLNGFLAFLLFAGALQVNSADMFERKWTILALGNAWRQCSQQCWSRQRCLRFHGYSASAYRSPGAWYSVP